MNSRLIAALSLAALLGGCTASLPPIDVTRFHTADVPRGDSVMVVPAPGQDGGSIQYRTYANAVAASLTRSGFSVVDSGRPAALSVMIDFDMAIDRPLDRRGSPVSVGVGGATGGYGSGMGVGIGINLSGPPKAVISSRLSVRMTRQGLPVWEGRAQMSAREGTPAAQPGIAAGKLADALFRDYPGQSGATITVK